MGLVIAGEGYAAHTYDGEVVWYRVCTPTT